MSAAAANAGAASGGSSTAPRWWAEDPRVKGIFQIVLSTTSFAVMAAISKVIGDRATTFEKIFWRSLISAVFTLVAHASERRAGRAKAVEWPPRRPLLMVARGLCGHLALTFYLEAVDRMPLAEAMIIGKIHPLAAAVMAYVFLGEPLRAARVAAIFASLAGVLIIVWPAEGGLAFENRCGAMLAFSAGVMTGAAYVCVRALALAGEGEVWMMLAFPLVALPLCTRDAWRGLANIDDDLSSKFLALGLATQGGQVFLTRGLVALPAAAGTQVMYCGTVVGVLLGVLLGDPWPSWRLWAGGALIVGSLLAADWAEQRAKRD